MASQGWITAEGKVLRTGYQYHAATAKAELGLTDRDPRAICSLAKAEGWIAWRVEDGGFASVDFDAAAPRSEKAALALRRVLGRPSAIYGDAEMWDSVEEILNALRKNDMP